MRSEGHVERNVKQWSSVARFNGEYGSLELVVRDPIHTESSIAITPR